MPLASRISLWGLSCLLTPACNTSSAPTPEEMPLQRLVTSGWCGQTEPSPEELARVVAQTAAMREHVGSLRAKNGHVWIPVRWHVIHDGTEGWLPAETVEAAVTVLNQAYSGAAGGIDTPFRFALASLDYTDNATFFTAGPNTTAERDMKESINTQMDPALHVYSRSVDLEGGYATFPWDYSEGSVSHAVVIDYRVLPGGMAAPLDEGDRLVHNVGHWLGLFHTFQGGCSGQGDQVDDTPAQKDPAYACPVGQDTCPGDDAPDPVHNYMNYTDDACMYEFTPGQVERMWQMATAYRPQLVALGQVCVADDECDDGDVCSGVETCDLDSGDCLPGSALVCDDGNACNGVETCDAGCQPGTPVACDDADLCNGLETCDPASGMCVSGDAPSCDDGDPCNGDERCDAAEGCVQGDPIVCEGTTVCDPQSGECVAACAPRRAPCTSDLDCCDGRCRGVRKKSGIGTCR